jgi:hypothetical protein
MRLDEDSVHANAQQGRAELELDRVRIPDFGNIPNSLMHHQPIGRGVLSLQLRWHGGGAVENIHDTTNDFGGRFIHGPASIRFHIREGDFSYTAAAAGQTTVYAAVGRERNGVFFP